MRETVRVCVPRILQIGKGSLDLIPDVLARIGSANRPLVVTDEVMVSQGIVGRVRERLAERNIRCGVFDGVIPDPTDEVVHAGLAVLEAGGHDCVVGLGGGSSMDAAKAMAVMARHPRDLLFYRPPREFDTPGLPMVAVPTTAGTGSEVTHHTVIVHAGTREKISCRGEAFVPAAAIVDYELTLSKPKRLIADNALDTLTHAIERSSRDCCWGRSTRYTSSACPGSAPNPRRRPRMRSRFRGTSSRTSCVRRFLPRR